MDFDIYGGSLNRYKSYGYHETIVIPDGVTRIGDYAFQGTGPDKIIIPDGVTEIGAGAFWGCSYVKSIVLPESLKSIGSKAFCACSSLEEIILPKGVESIGDEAFLNCDKLKELVLPDSLHSLGRKCIPRNVQKEYKGGYYLGTENNEHFCCVRHIRLEPEFHDNTILIGGGVFDNPRYVVSVKLPEQLQYVSPYAFENCIGLSEVFIKSVLSSLPAKAFSKCENVIIIAPGMSIDGFEPSLKKRAAAGYLKNTDLFEDDEIVSDYNKYIVSNLSKLLPLFMADDNAELLQRILEGANISSKKLEELIHVASVENAIKCQTVLKNLADAKGTANTKKRKQTEKTQAKEPDPIEEFCEKHYDPLTNCEALEAINIPKSVTQIGSPKIYGSSVFWGCNNIKDLYIPAETTEVRGIDCILHNKDLTIHTPAGSAAESLAATRKVRVIHDTPDNQSEESDESEDFVLTIDNGELKSCYGTKSRVEINETVTKVGHNAFANNKDITEVVLPDTVTSIGYYSFMNCENLKRFEAPQQLASMGKSAFEGCKQLESIVLNEGLNEISERAFKDCVNLKKIVIPSSVRRINPYAFANCKSLEQIIFERKEMTLGNYRDCRVFINQLHLCVQ